MAKQKLKTAAIVTIHNAPDMTKRGRTQIANWLRRQANLLESANKRLANRFRARWQYFLK